MLFRNYDLYINYDNSLKHNGKRGRNLFSKKEKKQIVHLFCINI